MKKIKMPFKYKVLIPTMAIFLISLLVVSVNEYRLLHRVVSSKIESELSVFNDNLMVQLHKLNEVIDVAEGTLSEQHLVGARAVLYLLSQYDDADITRAGLLDLCSSFGFTEINIAGPDGIITHSNFDEYIGFDYKLYPETEKYMELADGTIKELQEEPRLSVSDAEFEIYCHYTGIAREGGGFVQFGYDTDTISRLRAVIDIGQIVEETKVGETGYGIVITDGIISAHPEKHMLGRDLTNEAWFGSVSSGRGFAWSNIDGAEYYVSYQNMPGHTVLGVLPAAEYYKDLRESLIYTVVFIAVFLAIVYFALSFIMSRMLKPINNVTTTLEEIAKGNFDTRIKGDYNDEFVLIQNAINDMASSIAAYIDDKIQTERTIHDAEIEKHDLLVKVNYDALTGIHNRRFLDETLDHLMRTHSRSGGLLCVLMIDIDYFKMYNDIYGHNEGDECLIAVAKAISAGVIREDDIVTRYGGEEFCILLPNTGVNGAAQIAEKIRENIKTLQLKNGGSKVSEYVTVSIGGAAGKVRHEQNGEDFVKRADEALYASKQNGRDRYTFLPMV
ncbi:MAG: diguanylate cyclase [Oscillospiraceae bacterium]|nr:diguanylate cyclase [Oscillospiraceae bacterium]